MKGENKKELQELLQKLVSSVYARVKLGLLKKTLRPQKELYFRWKIQNFKYGDNGIIYSSGTGDNFLKPIWYSASRTIERKVEKLSIYKDVLKIIPKVSELEMPPGYLLSQLVSKVAWDTLENRVADSSQLTWYVISFLDDLRRKEHEYRAEVQLRGLVLRPDSIQLDADVRLRKPVVEDLEREEPAWFPYRVVPMENPTAFLHTRMRAKHGGVVVQNEIDREAAILRLFRVGAVQPIRYTLDTDSILDATGRGTITTGRRLLGPDKYLIKEEDVEPLKKFWSNMRGVELPIPMHTGTPKEPTPLSIAYQRYNDSLEGTILENRIFSAVMGLEALYLSEQQEMSYRLRMRVGKLLGLIGYNPDEVRERMKDAYEVRSTYVHGGILKQKDRRKYERKYGDLNKFSKAIMDYLRASIVALLKRPSKTSLIQKIDDSFLDNKKQEEIRKSLFMPYEKEVA